MIKGWETFDGRKILIDDITHQHLSNIYYYTHFTLPQCYPDSIRMEVRTELKNRFGGVILPYKPVSNFPYERERLQYLGYLQPDNTIVAHGQKLGAYTE